MPNFYLPFNQTPGITGSNSTIGALSHLFISFAHTEPHKLIEGANIAGVYGIPNSCSCWAAGRYIQAPPMLGDFMLDLNLLNSYNVGFCLTFTNSLITEKELGDVQGNMIMELANNGMNSVIVSSPYLEEYLRNRYPNFKYISSITKCEDSIDAINEACERYDLVVPNHFYNKNFEFLKQIKHPEKIKLLANSFCSSYCKKSAYHYNLIERVTLLNVADNEVDPRFECTIRGKDWAEVLKFKDTISNTDVYGKYSDMGFNHFKLEGRTDSPVDIVSTFTYYMVKPQYREEMNIRLLKILRGEPVSFASDN